jgi:hypothetical protein
MFDIIPELNLVYIKLMLSSNREDIGCRGQVHAYLCFYESVSK